MWIWNIYQYLFRFVLQERPMLMLQILMETMLYICVWWEDQLWWSLPRLVIITWFVIQNTCSGIMHVKIYFQNSFGYIFWDYFEYFFFFRMLRIIWWLCLWIVCWDCFESMHWVCFKYCLLSLYCQYYLLRLFWVGTCMLNLYSVLFVESFWVLFVESVLSRCRRQTQSQETGYRRRRR